MVELLPNMWEDLGSVTCTRNLQKADWASHISVTAEVSQHLCLESLCNDVHGAVAGS